MRRRERATVIRTLERLIEAGWGDIPQRLIPNKIRRLALLHIPDPPPQGWHEVAHLYQTDRLKAAEKLARQLLEADTGDWPARRRVYLLAHGQAMQARREGIGKTGSGRITRINVEAPKRALAASGGQD